MDPNLKNHRPKHVTSSRRKIEKQIHQTEIKWPILNDIPQSVEVVPSMTFLPATVNVCLPKKIMLADFDCISQSSDSVHRKTEQSSRKTKTDSDRRSSRKPHAHIMAHWETVPKATHQLDPLNSEPNDSGNILDILNLRTPCQIPAEKRKVPLAFWEPIVPQQQLPLLHQSSLETILNCGGLNSGVEKTFIVCPQVGTVSMGTNTDDMVEMKDAAIDVATDTRDVAFMADKIDISDTLHQTGIDSSIHHHESAIANEYTDMKKADDTVNMTEQNIEVEIGVEKEQNGKGKRDLSAQTEMRSPKRVCINIERQETGKQPIRTCNYDQEAVKKFLVAQRLKRRKEKLHLQEVKVNEQHAKEQRMKELNIKARELAAVNLPVKKKSPIMQKKPNWRFSEADHLKMVQQSNGHNAPLLMPVSYEKSVCIHTNARIVASQVAAEVDRHHLINMSRPSHHLHNQMTDFPIGDTSEATNNLGCKPVGKPRKLEGAAKGAVNARKDVSEKKISERKKVAKLSISDSESVNEIVNRALAECDEKMSTSSVSLPSNSSRSSSCSDSESSDYMKLAVPSDAGKKLMKMAADITRKIAKQGDLMQKELTGNDKASSASSYNHHVVSNVVDAVSRPTESQELKHNQPSMATFTKSFTTVTNTNNNLGKVETLEEVLARMRALFPPSNVTKLPGRSQLELADQKPAGSIVNFNDSVETKLNCGHHSMKTKLEKAEGMKIFLDSLKALPPLIPPQLPNLHLSHDGSGERLKEEAIRNSAQSTRQRFDNHYPIHSPHTAVTRLSLATGGQNSSRRNVNDHNFSYYSDSKQLNKAAVVIQSWYRGCCVRKKIVPLLHDLQKAQNCETPSKRRFQLMNEASFSPHFGVSATRETAESVDWCKVRADLRHEYAKIPKTVNPDSPLNVPDWVQPFAQLCETGNIDDFVNSCVKTMKDGQKRGEKNVLKPFNELQLKHRPMDTMLEIQKGDKRKMLDSHYGKITVNMNPSVILRNLEAEKENVNTTWNECTLTEGPLEELDKINDEMKWTDSGQQNLPAITEPRNSKTELKNVPNERDFVDLRRATGVKVHYLQPLLDQSVSESQNRTVFDPCVQLESDGGIDHESVSQQFTDSIYADNVRGKNRPMAMGYQWSPSALSLRLNAELMYQDTLGEAIRQFDELDVVGAAVKARNEALALSQSMAIERQQIIHLKQIESKRMQEMNANMVAKFDTLEKEIPNRLAKIEQELRAKSEEICSAAAARSAAVQQHVSQTEIVAAATAAAISATMSSQWGLMRSLPVDPHRTLELVNNVHSKGNSINSVDEYSSDFTCEVDSVNQSSLAVDLKGVHMTGSHSDESIIEESNAEVSSSSEQILKTVSSISEKIEGVSRSEVSEVGSFVSEHITGEITSVVPLATKKKYKFSNKETDLGNKNMSSKLKMAASSILPGSSSKKDEHNMQFIPVREISGFSSIHYSSLLKKSGSYLENNAKERMEESADSYLSSDDSQRDASLPDLSIVATTSRPHGATRVWDELVSGSSKEHGALGITLSVMESLQKEEVLRLQELKTVLRLLKQESSKIERKLKSAAVHTEGGPNLRKRQRAILLQLWSHQSNVRRLMKAQTLSAQQRQMLLLQHQHLLAGSSQIGARWGGSGCSPPSPKMVYKAWGFTSSSSDLEDWPFKVKEGGASTHDEIFSRKGRFGEVPRGGVKDRRVLLNQPTESLVSRLLETHHRASPERSEGRFANKRDRSTSPMVLSEAVPLSAAIGSGIEGDRSSLEVSMESQSSVPEEVISTGTVLEETQVSISEQIEINSHSEVVASEEVSSVPEECQVSQGTSGESVSEAIESNAGKTASESVISIGYSLNTDVMSVGDNSAMGQASQIPITTKASGNGSAIKADYSDSSKSCDSRPSMSLPGFRVALSPRSPLKQQHRRHSSESDDSFTMSQNETASDASDGEGRLLALREELAARKAEADRLQREKRRMRRERIASQEQALRQQIITYEQYIQRAKEELEKETRDAQQGSVKPLIRKPQVAETKKSWVAPHDIVSTEGGKYLEVNVISEEGSAMCSKAADILNELGTSVSSQQHSVSKIGIVDELGDTFVPAESCSAMTSDQKNLVSPRDSVAKVLQFDMPEAVQKEHIRSESSSVSEEFSFETNVDTAESTPKKLSLGSSNELEEHSHSPSPGSSTETIMQSPSKHEAAIDTMSSKTTEEKLNAILTEDSLKITLSGNDAKMIPMKEEMKISPRQSPLKEYLSKISPAEKDMSAKIESPHINLPLSRSEVKEDVDTSIDESISEEIAEEVQSLASSGECTENEDMEVNLEIMSILNRKPESTTLHKEIDHDLLTRPVPRLGLSPEEVSAKEHALVQDRMVHDIMSSLMVTLVNETSDVFTQILHQKYIHANKQEMAPVKVLEEQTNQVTLSNVFLNSPSGSKFNCGSTLKKPEASTPSSKQDILKRVNRLIDEGGLSPRLLNTSSFIGNDASSVPQLTFDLSPDELSLASSDQESSLKYQKVTPVNVNDDGPVSPSHDISQVGKYSLDSNILTTKLLNLSSADRDFESNFDAEEDPEFGVEGTEGDWLDDDFWTLPSSRKQQLQLREQEKQLIDEISRLEELKRLQEQYPDLVLREVPNKPPPPYTPPGADHRPQVPFGSSGSGRDTPIIAPVVSPASASFSSFGPHRLSKADMRKLTSEVYRAVPDSEAEVTVVIEDAVKLFFDALIDGRDFATVQLPQAVLVSPKSSSSGSNSEPDEETNVQIFRHFLYCLVREILGEIHEALHAPPCPPWVTQPPLNPLQLLLTSPQHPLTSESLVTLVKARVALFMGWNGTGSKESLMVRWARKHRDVVDQVLVRELQVEEAGWTRYAEDEAEVKLQVADEIFALLINETVSLFANLIKHKLSLIF